MNEDEEDDFCFKVFIISSIICMLILASSICLFTYQYFTHADEKIVFDTPYMYFYPHTFNKSNSSNLDINESWFTNITISSKSNWIVNESLFDFIICGRSNFTKIIGYIN